jgi:hypothetical protein
MQAGPRTPLKGDPTQRRVDEAFPPAWRFAGLATAVAWLAVHVSLIAAVEHGPGMHGPVLLALFLVAVVGAIVYGLRQLVQSRREERKHEHD